MAGCGVYSCGFCSHTRIFRQQCSVWVWVRCRCVANGREPRPTALRHGAHERESVPGSSPWLLPADQARPDWWDASRYAAAQAHTAAYMHIDAQAAVFNAWHVHSGNTLLITLSKKKKKELPKRYIKTASQCPMPCCRTIAW